MASTSSSTVPPTKLDHPLCFPRGCLVPVPGANGPVKMGGMTYQYVNGQVHSVDGPGVRDAVGNVGYCQSGQFHRVEGPAIVAIDGCEMWMKQGVGHRVGGPAITRYQGFGKKRQKEEIYCEEGLIHRQGAPAVVRPGCEAYYERGVLHREDGPAVKILLETGVVEERWYRQGQLHRDGGPAISNSDGDQLYYRDGVLHREDGPAKILGNGFVANYKNGMRVFELNVQTPPAKNVAVAPVIEEKDEFTMTSPIVSTIPTRPPSPPAESPAMASKAADQVQFDLGF